MALDISGEYRMAIAKQRVWDALNDPAVLQKCIAGCRSLEKVADNEFNAIVVAKVGPISATFRGNLTLSEIDAPHSYVLTGRGQGGAAGFASMSARVSLEEATGETVLRYTASADIGGKLANVGSRLVQSVAKKNADDFFAAFAASLGSPEKKAVTAPEPEVASPIRTSLPVTALPGAATTGLGALVPGWVLLFASGLSFALGYCVALLR